ncbi:MAG: NAD-dependent epimerase/dehydratase family protein [Gemmatimonadota bacterium]|nr:NAD-dependent epimerase/dehydratase family protein [Gemmatimonadota bacterium]
MHKHFPYDAFSGTRVLVTGATGFIGQHLCAALIRTNAQVYGLRRPGNSPRWWSLDPERVTWLEADLNDRHRLESVVRPIQATHIIHLAATTPGERGLHTVGRTIGDNLLGTMHLLQVLDGTGYTCFIQTGSAEEYGATVAPFHEDAPLKPVSPYSASKAAASLFCDMFHRTLGCPTVVIRPFLVYGPGQPPDKLIPQTILAALTNQPFRLTSGRQTREFTYIDDLIDGYLRAAMTKDAIGQTINLGTGLALPVVEIVTKIIEMTGSTITPEVGALPDRTGEIMSYVCDNSKAGMLLGWSPSISLEDGLQTTIEWYRQAIDQGRLPLDRSSGTSYSNKQF